MDNSEKYSIHVSKTLDCMGYNRDMINYRVKKYKERSYLYSERSLDHSSMIVGSKGEGLSASLKSDYDNMVVMENILCDANPKRDTMFQMDTRYSPPGYTKLKLFNVIEDDDIVNSLVHFVDRGLYISSEIFLKYNVLPNLLRKCKLYDKLLILSEGISISSSGPAGTGINHLYGSKWTFDTVTSFPCIYLSLLDSWKNRRRDYNWPPLELMMNIHNTDIGYVVPVGPKGSDNQHLEWRICFTTIEQKLINLLNDTQIKLYVLLKMVAKEILQPTFEDITSYVLKNIVLWMAELLPVELFRDHLLINRLMQALHFLKYCVQTNCMPCYMIPKRNLIERKMTYLQRLKFADSLSEIISYGGGILLTCEKFKMFTICLYKVPHKTLHFALKRGMIEKLYILVITLIYSLLLEGLINEHLNLTESVDVLRNIQLYRTIIKVLVDLVMPEWRVFIYQGMDDDTYRYNFSQRLHNYVS